MSISVNHAEHSTRYLQARDWLHAMNSRNGVIAIVDDDQAVRDSTRVLLEVYGLDVQTYPSGTDFLENNPDIAFLIVDYQMPGLNGLELVSELRKRGSNVRTVLITATSNPRVERRAAELGIKQVLQKPLSSRVLLTAIREDLE